MALSDEDFDAARLSLLAAAFDPDTWPEAMAWIGKAGGGWASQIVGLSRARGLTAHYTSQITTDMLEGLADYDWLNPSTNPRSRLALRPSSFEVVDDHNLASSEELARNELYNDFYNKVDTPYVGAAKFDAIDDISVGVFSIRSRRVGLPSSTDKSALGALLPHLRAAMRTQILFETQATALLTGSLENVGLAAFLCAADGRIVSRTPSGFRETTRRTYLVERNGVLGASHNGVDTTFRKAIALAGRHTPVGSASTVVLRNGHGASRLVDVVPLPRGPYSTGTGAVVLVAMNQARKRDEIAVLRAAYELTDAEAQVAVRLAAGDTIADIADRRGASQMTVRTQVKKILEKLAVTTQGQAITKILRLTGQPIEGTE